MDTFKIWLYLSTECCEKVYNIYEPNCSTLGSTTDGKALIISFLLFAKFVCHVVIAYTISSKA